jgi:hypothetical protein
MIDDIKKGDVFVAVVKKSDFSKTLGGVEGSGKRLPPMIATKVNGLAIETETHILDRTRFYFEKIDK